MEARKVDEEKTVQEKPYHEGRPLEHLEVASRECMTTLAFEWNRRVLEQEARSK